MEGFSQALEALSTESSCMRCVGGGYCEVSQGANVCVRVAVHRSPYNTEEMCDNNLFLSLAVFTKQEGGGTLHFSHGLDLLISQRIKLKVSGVAQNKLMGDIETSGGVNRAHVFFSEKKGKIRVERTTCGGSMSFSYFR